MGRANSTGDVRCQTSDTEHYVNDKLGYSVIADAFVDEHPLLGATSKLPKINNATEPLNESKKIPENDAKKSTKPVNISKLNIPGRIPIEQYFIDDIVIPEIEPIDMIPLDPCGFLYLPEQGIETELNGLDFHHEKTSIIEQALHEVLEQSDEIAKQFDFDNLISDLKDELGLPAGVCEITLEEAQEEMKKEIFEHNARLEKERLKQAALEIKPENKEDRAFTELEKVLQENKSKTILQTDLLDSDSVWNMFESTTEKSDILLKAWNQIHAAWKSLLLAVNDKQHLSAVYASQDEDYMEKTGVLWRDLAHAIRAREMKLLEFQEFLFEQAEPHRFWQRGYCPMREENRREKVRAVLRERTKNVEKLLDELEPRCKMQIPWTNRTYREKMEKDEVEVFYFVHHALRCTSDECI